MSGRLSSSRTQGTRCFRRKDLPNISYYHGALRRYDEALGGPNGRGDRRPQPIGTLLPLLNNRAACHLELADAMSGYGEERVHAYKRASYDAEDAAKLSRMMGGNAKALFRLGRATVGVQSLRSRLVDAAEARGQTDAAERPCGCAKWPPRRSMSASCISSRPYRLQLQEGNRSISDKLDEAERLQAALERRGAPPPSKAPTPVVRPEKFAASVVFTPGDSWMSNKVALPLPVPKRVGGNAMLPMYLTKQKNDRNRGELAIWILYSDHLGEGELDARGEEAYGEDAQYSVAADQPHGALSTPAQADTRTSSHRMSSS